MGPCGLRILWSRVSSPQEQIVAALACLNWLLFRRVSEALSITPAGLASNSVVLFVTAKVGGHREVRRPVYGWGQPSVHFLRAYAQACCSCEGQPLVQGGVEAAEKTFARLLRDSPTRVTSSTTYGKESLPPPSTAPPTSPTSFAGGGGASRPRLWSTLLGNLTIRWLQHWCCCGLMAFKLLMGGWLCSWQSSGAMPCMPNPRGPPQVRCQRYLYVSVRGLLYLLVTWGWRRLKKRWTMMRLILIQRPFRPHPRGLEGP